MVPTRVSRCKRQAMSIAVALFVFALLTLSGNAELTPITAAATAPNSQTPAQPTPTPTPRPILLTDPAPDPKQAGVQYFPQTGHTLRGAFLDYWQRYGGLAQFGYPLTEEFFEEISSDHEQYQVQYFERNRFELHPENKGTQYEVLLGVLGRDFRQQDSPATPITGTAYFQETGHNLSGAFKQYWDAHGGLFVHGYPMTEPQIERSTNGKEYLVQWFERSRFELHPENAGSPYEVLLGVLGRQLSEKKGYPYGWYPVYGRAADFSWVAGAVWEYSLDTSCTAAICGCGITNIERRHTLLMQMTHASDPNSPPNLDITREEYIYDLRPTFVFFGRTAASGEKYVKCAIYPDAPGYFVAYAQRNPTK